MRQGIDFGVVIPPPLRVGAGTIRIFRSREDAERFLSSEDKDATGWIEQFQE
jgi:hypothetical protein